jgi:O-acetylhomoserine (thiol)-lyase
MVDLFLFKARSMKNLRSTTRIIHTPFPRKDVHESLNFPVYDSNAFEAETAEELEMAFKGEKPRHLYSRITNPTVEYFEAKIKNLTGAYAVTALSSGMAAISNLIMGLGKAGDNIISSLHLFGNTVSLFNKTLKPYHLNVKYTDLTDPEKVEKLVDENTIAIFFETITNPQLEVAGIGALASIAKKHNLILIADTTLTPPNVFDASAMGIHFEVLSSTKFLSGGATSVGGLVIDYGTYDWSRFEKIKEMYQQHGSPAFNMMFRKQVYRNLGACLSAHNAYLQSLGLDTLDLRTRRSAENTQAVAQWLEKNPRIQKVHYPGLPSSPFHKIAIEQFGEMPCSLLTFDLGSKAECFQFMNRLKVIRRSTNLQDNKTLIIHPSSTIFVEYPEDQKTSMGLRDTMIRLSVGIEDAEDLIEDLDQALA